MVAAVDGVEHALFRQQLQQLAALGAELFALLKRQLEGGALQVADADDEVVGVDEAGLGRRLEEVLGVSRHVLVQRRRVGDEDGERRLVAAAGAAHLLPGAGQRARIAEEHGGVEPADVDPQLEGVGGDDAAHASAAQAGFDGAALAAAGSRRGSPRQASRRASKAGHRARWRTRSSTVSRLGAKTMVWTPCRTRRAASDCAAFRAERRMPSSRLTTGGL